MLSMVSLNDTRLLIIVSIQRRNNVKIRTLNKSDLSSECPWLNSEDIEMSALVDQGAYFDLFLTLMNR
jgi:hypothetical protein